MVSLGLKASPATLTNVTALSCPVRNFVLAPCTYSDVDL